VTIPGMYTTTPGLWRALALGQGYMPTTVVMFP
jgi:hypothetical protein